MVSESILILVMLGMAGLLMAIGGAVFTAVLCLRKRVGSRSSHEEGKVSSAGRCVPKRRARNARSRAKGPVCAMKRERGTKVKMVTQSKADVRGGSATVGSGDRAGVGTVKNTAYGHVRESGVVGSGDRAGVGTVKNTAYGHVGEEGGGDRMVRNTAYGHVVGEGGGGGVGSGDRAGVEMVRNTAYGHVGGEGGEGGVGGGDRAGVEMVGYSYVGEEGGVRMARNETML